MARWNERDPREYPRTREEWGGGDYPSRDQRHADDHRWQSQHDFGQEDGYDPYEGGSRGYQDTPARGGRGRQRRGSWPGRPVNPAMGPAGFGAPYYQPAAHDEMGAPGNARTEDYWWPPGPGRAPAGDQRNQYYGRERDFFDKAADEVSSWFGDEAAHARREQDHRGRGPRNYQRSDARIEEDVNDRLTDDPMVDGTEITVTVKDREVTLDGHVHSRAAKRRAEDCADSVSGVTHVQNNLRVQSASGNIGNTGSDIAG